MKKYTKEQKRIQYLFERLHFEFGLEDVNHLHYLKPKSIEHWCKTIGQKLHQISFALAMEGDIDYVLKIAEEKK